MNENFSYHFKMKRVMADLTRLEELTLKRLLGELSPDEEQELQALAQASAENRQFIESMSPEAFHKKRKSLEGHDYSRLDRLVKQKTGYVPGIFDWIRAEYKESSVYRYVVAAAAGLAVGVSLWLIYKPHGGQVAAHRPIRATLSWQSKSNRRHGPAEPAVFSSISLGEMEEGIAKKIGGILVARMTNEFIISRRQDTVLAAKDSIEYVIDLDGRQDIQVYFPDSISAQLHPGSSLSFMNYAPGTILKERRMTCSGQVLFNVGHNFALPFIVKTPKQEIKVLGTCFGIHDYSKEDTAAVFCYTGMVSVKGSDSPGQILRTSQRATVHPRHQLKVSTGDFPTINWSSPELLFDFSTVDLDSAMNDIAHWYGITKVIFKGVDRKTPGRVFIGKLSRYLPLPQLLSILERDDLHFTIDGREILVTGSTNRPDHDH